MDRLKDLKKDLSILSKYASSKELEMIQELGLDLESTSRGLNPVAQTALDIMTEKKSLTNEELYNWYLDSLNDAKTADSYTQFNIRIRPLFNSQYVSRKKGKDPKNSREDIILSLSKSK